MAQPTDEVAPAERCPRCASLRVVAGQLTGVGVPPVFAPLALKRSVFPMVPRSVSVGDAQVCLACGLLWASVDPLAATRVIRAVGTEALKRRVLDGPAALPIPADAPTPDAETLPRPAAPPPHDPDQLPRPIPVPES
ncbi:MAG TPA: hypothetical protein VK689_22320 [Armatimonadota bacterium]|nr:hypothetical protein [Armatimonadota bacterium]